MALSEEEQRLLDELEASLMADDPRLARTMRSTGSIKVHRRSATLAGVGFLLGIVLLIGGMQVHPLISVLGFVFMLASTVLAIESWQHVNDEPTGSAGSKSKSSAHSGSQNRPFMDRMEDRWRRRQGDL